MVDLPDELSGKRFYKISEVAARWGKTEDEILVMVENCNLEALCQYEGNYFEAGLECRAGASFFSVDGWAHGWYRIPAEAASAIRLRGTAALGMLTSYWSVYDVTEEEFLDSDLMEDLNSCVIWPAIKTEYKGLPAWERGTHEISIEDLAFSDLALWDAENKYPELCVAPSPAPPSQGNQVMERKPDPDPLLNPAERKTVAKLIFAMAVDCYGYDPTQKQSPTTKAIMEAAARADVSITEDTIRKWLKKGASLRTTY